MSAGGIGRAMGGMAMGVMAMGGPMPGRSPMGRTSVASGSERWVVPFLAQVFVNPKYLFGRVVCVFP